MAASASVLQADREKSRLTGCDAFLPKPIKLDQLDNSIQRAGQNVYLHRELDHLRSVQHGEEYFIVGHTRLMRSLVDQAKRRAEGLIAQGPDPPNRHFSLLVHPEPDDLNEEQLRQAP